MGECIQHNTDVKHIRDIFTKDKDDNTDEKKFILALEMAFEKDKDKNKDKDITVSNMLETQDINYGIDVPNEIIPHLFLGSGDYAEHKIWLVTNKISYIINVGQPETSLLSLLEDYLIIKLEDNEKSNIKQYFEKSNEFIHNAISKNKNIFIHCRAGRSRSPTIVCAYLMKYHKLNFMDAVCKITNYRYICPNKGFWSQLEEYDKELQCLTPIKYN